MNQRIEIDRNKKLEPGDIVELEYDMIGSLNWTYFRATQTLLLEYYLNKKNPYWKYLSLRDTEDQLILRFEVLPIPEDATPQIQQAGVTAAIISAFVLGTFIFAYLALDKIYLIKKLPDKPSDVIKSASIGFGAIASVLVILFLWGKLGTR
jgi:hypothetical protein